MSKRIEFHEDTESLRIEWDNRRLRKDRFTFWFLILFWAIWCPATLFVTAVLLAPESEPDSKPVIFLLVWLLFGWLGTI